MIKNMNEADFAMKVHQLLGTLGACGIGLIKLPEPHSVATTDVVDDLREAIEVFGRVEGLNEGPRHLLHNYLSDHLFENDGDGFESIRIEKEGFTRASKDA